jgi:hypothetical protein
MAASHGNWREVRNLLLDGADPSDSDCEGLPFTPGLDDEEMLLRSFVQLDDDGDQNISLQELVCAMENQEDTGIISSMETVKQKLFGQTPSPMKLITFREFKDACVTIPRIKGYRVEWTRSLHLDLMLAKRLNAGVLWDGLLGFKQMQRGEVEKACSDFAVEVLDEVMKRWDILQQDNPIRPVTNQPQQNGQTGTSSEPEENSPIQKPEGETTDYQPTIDSWNSAQSMMSKFRAEQGSCGKYGSKEIFDGGLEVQLGMADPCILRAILREHVSKEGFMTSNYRIFTSPLVEYARVLGKERLDEPAGEEKAMGVENLYSKAKKSDKKYPSEAELIGLKDMLDQINNVHDIFLKNRKGHFPGEIGSCVWELQTYCVEVQNTDDSQANFESELLRAISMFASDNLVLDAGESSFHGVGMNLSSIENCRDLLRLNFILQFSGESNQAERSRKLEDFKTFLNTKLLMLSQGHTELQDQGRKLASETSNAQKSEMLQIVEKATVAKSMGWMETKEQCFVYSLFADKESIKTSLEANGINTRHAQFMHSDPNPQGISLKANDSLSSLMYEFDKETDFLSKKNLTRRQGRRSLSIIELMCDPQVQLAGLRVEEAVQAYQYTGPLFQVWNSVLRKMPFGGKIECFNKYTTSIHTLVSAVVKLSRQTRIPVSRKVYRGLGGLVLDDQWFECDKRGVRGAVELGFLSTTLNRDVALTYSGVKKNRGVLFEIEIGAVDCGAQINSISQYPGEAEMLFGPLSNLETTGTRLETFEGKNVIIVSLKINSNLKGSVIEDLIEKRKQMLMSMRDSACDELAFDLKILAFDDIARGLKSLTISDGATDSANWVSESEVQKAKHELKQAINVKFEGKQADYFNSDKNVQDLLALISDLKRNKIRKFINEWKERNENTEGFQFGIPIMREAVLRMTVRGRSDLFEILRVSGATLHGLADENQRNILQLACECCASGIVTKILKDKANAMATQVCLIVLSPLFLISVLFFAEGTLDCIKMKSPANQTETEISEDVDLDESCKVLTTFGGFTFITMLAMLATVLYATGISDFEFSDKSTTKFKNLGVIWRYLRDCIKVKIDAQDKYGSTALHYALKKGDHDIIKDLLDAGADVNLRNQAGKSFVDLVEETNDLKVRWMFRLVNLRLQRKGRTCCMPKTEYAGVADGDAELGFDMANP